MENTNINETVSLIEMVLNEDLVQAKSTIVEKLNEKLALAMGERFEEYAPTIFEEKMAKKDWDGDGKIESNKDEVWGSRKKAANKKGKWLKEAPEIEHDEDFDNAVEEMMANQDMSREAAQEEVRRRRNAIKEETYCEDGECEDMEDSEDVETSEEQSEEKEENKSDKKKGKKSKKSDEEEEEEK